MYKLLYTGLWFAWIEYPRLLQLIVQMSAIALAILPLHFCSGEFSEYKQKKRCILIDSGVAVVFTAVVVGLLVLQLHPTDPGRICTTLRNGNLYLPTTV